MWQGISVTGGVTKRRRAQSLEPGEYVQATNCRLKPNDTVQIHNDVGTVTFATPTLLSGFSIVGGPFVMRFESGTEILFFVSSDGSTGSQFHTAPVGATGTVSVALTIGGVMTAADVVHRGNEYFILTDYKNYVTNDGSTFREMGADKQDSGASAISITTPGATSTAAIGDTFRYFLTEYESANDVESEPYYRGGVEIATAGDTVSLDWTANYTQKNAAADKIRVYRHYFGNNGGGGGAELGYLDYGDTDNPVWLGGLLAEQDIATTTYSDLLSNGPLDPTPAYPLIQTDEVFGGAIYPFLKQTRPATLGALYNDMMVLNNPATSKQILRYSPPGYPEYQPNPYFTYFATEDSDEIVGLHKVNNKLVILTTGGAHRLNYLPTVGDLSAEQGRVQEVITQVAGCVGRQASTVVQTERGEFVVWVSERGLEWTNGAGWTDACPDFDTNEIVTSDVVLVNNESLYRLELYSNGSRWDFYYHPSHIKAGALKLMGPSTAPASGLVGGCHNETYVWVADSTNVYTVGVGNSSADTVLESGHYRGPTPMADLEAQAFALGKSGTSGTEHRFVVYGKQLGVAEATAGPYTMPDGDQEEVGKVEFGQHGKYLRTKLTIEGNGAWAAGPSWLQVHVTEGG